ncbi:MAG: DUF3011 domain-containing protein [Betaproteobacteria bacterium]|nr:DUF3011 domain-containing protein [Betaproteobacteria bacterium]
MRYLSAALLLSAATIAAVVPTLAQAQPRGGPPQVIVRCESDNGRYRECRIPDRARIALSRQLSNSSCVENRSWGVKKNRVWVDRGCRAEFSAIGGAWSGKGWSGSILCASEDYRTVSCRWDSRQGRPRLLEQVSGAACVEGKSWGVARNGDVWVSNGCRGRFGGR